MIHDAVDFASIRKGLRAPAFTDVNRNIRGTETIEIEMV
jgi:hypothetical protein